MYKNAAVSELLFYMALRLKGGMGVNRIWTKKYRERLEGVLSFMDMSAALLKTRRDISKDEIMPLVEFVNQNTDWLFLVKRIDPDDFFKKDSEQVLTDNCDWDALDEKIVGRMEKIVFEAKNCLKSRKIGYKRKIQQLFHAYHNLPRAYLSHTFSPDAHTTFLGRDYSRWALSKKLALEYSQI